jgi:hypothetical protein
MTRDEFLHELRLRNEGLRDKSDIEIEAIVGRADPRARDFFDRARGALPPEQTPIDDPSKYDAGGPLGAVASTLHGMQSVGLARNADVIKNVKLPTQDEMIEGGISSLPGVTATIGGMAALPLAAAGGLATGGAAAVPIEMLGSGTGAVPGEYLRQWIQQHRGKENLTPEQSREAMAKEFVINSTLPAVTGLAHGVARGLYKGALDASSGVLNKFKIGDLVDRGLSEGIVASRRGADKLGGLLTESGGISRSIADAADRRGVAPVSNPQDIVRPALDPLVDKAASENLQDASVNTLADAEDQFLRSRSTPRTMSDLERSVREGTIRSSAAYKAESKLGTPITMATEADTALTDQQRRILQQKVPEIVPEKKRAGELVGLSEVLRSKKEPVPLSKLDIGVGTLAGMSGLKMLGPYGAFIGPGAMLAMQSLRSPFARSVAALGSEHIVAPASRYILTPAIRYRDALMRMLASQNDQQQTPPGQ